MTVNLVDSAIKNLRSVEKDLTKALKLDAKRAGWPANVVNTLNVRVLRNEIVVNYPETYSESVDDLEYGSLEASPKPVFRTFINKHIGKITSNLEDTLAKELSRLEG
jgi:hypothetical protein